MAEEIEFREVELNDPETKRRKGDAIAVIRNGHQVAFLPEAKRLRRALNLPLKEIEYTFNNFSTIMGREPTSDEREFWRAVLDFKRGQES
jgi:hypothetical protein